MPALGAQVLAAQAAQAHTLAAGAQLRHGGLGLGACINGPGQRQARPALVRPSRWSNRHESAYASPGFDRFVDNVALAGGNGQPILVRQEGAGYELVYGQRRHRACAELGLAVFAVVWVGPMSDLDHFLAMERENREREDLSPYEQGRMYVDARLRLVCFATPAGRGHRR